MSRVEARWILRHPLFWLAMLAGAVLVHRPWMRGAPVDPWVGMTYYHLGLDWFPLYLGTFLLANSAALREREATTAELFRTMPRRLLDRTRAQLLAGVVPVAAAVLLAEFHRAVMVGAGGVDVGGVIRVPGHVETALPAAITAAAWTAGFAFARTVGSRLAAGVFGVAFVFFAFVMYWSIGWYPLIVAVPHISALHDATSAPDVSLMAWHLVYLLGITAVFAAYALRRSGGQTSDVAAPAIGGAVAVVAGIAMQLAVLDPLHDWQYPF